MIKVIRNQQVLEIQSRMPVGKRILFLLFALIPLIAPYQLIIQPDWDDFINFFLLFALLISIGALFVSAFFALGALAGLDSRMKFDRTEEQLTYSQRAPIFNWRSSSYSFKDINKIRLTTREWTDGPPSYALEVSIVSGDSLLSESSWAVEEIEELVSEVKKFLFQT